MFSWFKTFNFRFRREVDFWGTFILPLCTLCHLVNTTQTGNLGINILSCSNLMKIEGAFTKLPPTESTVKVQVVFAVSLSLIRVISISIFVNNKKRIPRNSAQRVVFP